MKRKHISKISAVMLCVLLLISVCAVPVFANSAQSYWAGVDQSGAIIVDGDSPIIVEKEILTFDLQEFPKNYYADVEDFLAYTGKVTAEYTFYNPSDMTVTAKLLFPFGCQAQYADLYDYENGVRLDNVDTEKYDILINGEPIDKKIRHTLSSHSQQFVLDKDLGLVSDTFAQDEFYSPDLTVTKYTFKISGVDTETYKAADVAFDVPQGMGSYRIYFPEQSGAHTQDNKEMRIGTGVQKNEREFDLYVFGTAFTTMPEWKAYENGGVEDNEEIAGTVDLVSTETLTFKEFVLSNWDEASGVSDVDWYNAALAEITDSNNHYDNYPIAEPYRYANGFQDSLMRWYEYEITLEAGERIVNTVTAPIYPSIDLRYEPDVFGYTYLLSPAKTWKSFGELEIVINTPYYISSCSKENEQLIVQGKGKKTRPIPVDKDQMKIIKKYLDYARVSGRAPGDYLISSSEKNGVLHEKRSLQNWMSFNREKFMDENRADMKEEGKKNRHETISWHGLRHNYAQRRFEEVSKVSPEKAKKVVSHDLGHGRDTVTPIYLPFLKTKTK